MVCAFVRKNGLQKSFSCIVFWGPNFRYPANSPTFPPHARAKSRFINEVCEEVTVGSGMYNFSATLYERILCRYLCLNWYVYACGCACVCACTNLNINLHSTCPHSTHFALGSPSPSSCPWFALVLSSSWISACHHLIFSSSPSTARPHPRIVLSLPSTCSYLI